MRRMNNLVTLFSAMFAFFFGCFLTKTLTDIENCSDSKRATFNPDDHREILLMILILTAPNYFDRREAIRNTWLKFSKPTPLPNYPEDFIYIPDYDEHGFLEQETTTEQSDSIRLFHNWLENRQNSIDILNNVRIKHVFAIGTKNLNPSIMMQLHQEKEKHNDLLLMEELEDSYSKLSLKLLTSIDRLVHKFNFKYLLKTDDDTYVKLDLLKNELLSYDTKLQRKSSSYGELPLPEFYWGYFNGHAEIKTKGKWKETNYNLCVHYQPYALGGGYVISKKIADFIAINSKILNNFVNEDVSMGAWLSSLKNVYRKHDIRFDTSYMPRKCKQHHLLLHKKSINEMTDLYEKKSFCTSESSADNEKSKRRPLEYYYDWKKSPDNCCKTKANENNG